jgi:hypothetical protein
MNQQRETQHTPKDIPRGRTLQQFKDACKAEVRLACMDAVPRLTQLAVEARLDVHQPDGNDRIAILIEAGENAIGAIVCSMVATLGLPAEHQKKMVRILCSGGAIKAGQTLEGAALGLSPPDITTFYSTDGKVKPFDFRDHLNNGSQPC